MDLASKLQIKAGQSVAVVNAPRGVSLPFTPADGEVGSADAVIGFAISRDQLGLLDTVIAAALADRLAWIGYPKGGKLDTDLNRDRLAEAMAAHGVQPVRQVSIDDTWSALRFRPAAAG